ncbi:carbohydrate-binding domain-containing protein, partial [Cellulomonas timonensis]|uniref:carbohydrate-binding domain-containing protein n=1 Tax=Cellulomonas timonensis TaxID=1689271 RepID=UPI0009EEEC7F
MRRTTLTHLLTPVAAFALLAGCTSTAAVDSSETGDSSASASTSAATPATDADLSVEEAMAANASAHTAAEAWDPSDEVPLTLNGDSATADDDGVRVDGSTVTLTAPGTYRLSGTLDDGQVVVDSAGDGLVRVILDGAEITSSTTSPLQFLDADEAVVVLADGTSNRLSDASTYVYPDAATDEPNAALFSTADLTLTGGGALHVEGNANDAIASKDGLVIDSGSLTVDAVDDGIRGKDYLVVRGGDLDVEAGGDALKSDNDEDETMGYVAVSGGDLTLVAGDDGIAAATDVIVSGGALDVTTGGGSSASVAADASPKGLVGDVCVIVGAGDVLVSAADDAIHSDGAVHLAGGAVTLASGDDGIHANNALRISGGSVDVTRSYEGLEAAQVTVVDGQVSVVASDDGINAAGGDNDASEDEWGDAPAPGGGDAADGSSLTITGGTVVLDAGGDGFDSNGSASLSGGTLVVHGPTNGGNGSIDVAGTFDVTGGELIAVGSSGMAQTPAASSAQSFVALSLTGQAGDVVHILDSDGNQLAVFETTKQYGSVIYSSAEVVAGEEYQAAVGGTITGETVGGLGHAGDTSGATVTATGTAGQETR